MKKTRTVPFLIGGVGDGLPFEEPALGGSYLKLPYMAGEALETPSEDVYRYIKYATPGADRAVVFYASEQLSDAEAFKIVWDWLVDTAIDAVGLPKQAEVI